MARPRSHTRRGLPDNLYERGGYFSYRNPETGRELGIGYDRAQAIAEAEEANQYFVKKSAGTLVSRIAADVRTIAAFIPRYRELLETRKIAPATLYRRKWHADIIEKEIGGIVVGPRQEDATEITRQVADWLQDMEKAGRQHTARALRGRLIEIFSDMAAAGWVAVNPIEVINIDTPAVKRARLNLDDFWKIHQKAGELYPWAPRALELGLVSLQRREDIAGMGFRHQVDGRLLVEQGKSIDSETGLIQMRLRIPTTLRLRAVDWSLEDIIKRCRDDVVSRYLVHHGRNQGKADAGDPVHPNTITAAFAEARDLSGITIPAGKTPPTFHELRSLGIRLYQQQGYDPQVLAGHKHPETTAIYTDNRGAEWIDVAA